MSFFTDHPIYSADFALLVEPYAFRFVKKSSNYFTAQVLNIAGELGPFPALPPQQKSPWLKSADILSVTVFIDKDNASVDPL